MESLFTDDDDFCLYVIYGEQPVYPGKHVVWRFNQTIYIPLPRPRPERKPFGLAPSLEEARQLVPATHCASMPRFPNANRQVIEIWMMPITKAILTAVKFPE